MNKWPINTTPCDHDSCDSTDTTPCYYTLYRHDMPLWEGLVYYGIKQAWRFWQHGWVDVLDGYYCPKHAKEEGFCWGCGRFYEGASERFDFELHGQWLCDGCWENYQAEIADVDEKDDEYWESFLER